MLAYASMTNLVSNLYISRLKIMANLSVRNLDNTVYMSIRLQAADKGVSMEEEVRRILARGVAPPKRISEIFRKNFGAKNGITLDLRHKAHEPMEFDE